MDVKVQPHTSQNEPPLLSDVRRVVEKNMKWQAVEPLPLDLCTFSPQCVQQISHVLHTRGIGCVPLDELYGSQIAEDLREAFDFRGDRPDLSSEDQRNSLGERCTPKEVLSILRESGKNHLLNEDSRVFHFTSAQNWAFLRSVGALNILDVEQFFRIHLEQPFPGMDDFGVFTETSIERTLQSVGEHGRAMLDVSGVHDLKDPAIEALEGRGVLLQIDLSYFANVLPEDPLVVLNGYAGEGERDHRSVEVVLPYLPPKEYVTEVAQFIRAT